MKHLVEVVRELKKKEERNFVRKTRLTTCGLMPYRFSFFFIEVVTGVTLMMNHNRAVTTN